MRAPLNATPALLAGLVSMLLAHTATASDDASALGAWRDYAVQGMTPDFDWAERKAVEPTVLNRIEARTALLPELAFASGTSNGLTVAMTTSMAGDTPGFESGGLSSHSITRAGTGIERTFVAPSLSRTFGGNSTVSASLVLAHQQFATMGFGETAESDQYVGNPLLEESSVGSGVRVAVRQQLSESVGFTTAYQSKLDMQEFQTYRGLFSDPGDFDIPAVASAGLDWNVGPSANIGIGVQRVMYSDVSAFTSAALPTRLLSLLGDGTSPVFAWRDLTIYSLDWSWRPTTRNELTLRYTTQQQPEPTSRLLHMALADEFTDNNVAVALTHRFARAGSLRFAASYAPTQYFLGNASFLDPDARGDQVEVEAVYRLDF